MAVRLGDPGLRVTARVSVTMRDLVGVNVAVRRPVGDAESVEVRVVEWVLQLCVSAMVSVGDTETADGVRERVDGLGVGMAEAVGDRDPGLGVAVEVGVQVVVGVAVGEATDGVTESDTVALKVSVSVWERSRVSVGVIDQEPVPEAEAGLAVPV